MPELVELQQQYGGESFRVVGLTTAGALAAEQFASRNHAGYPVYALARAQFEAMDIAYVPAVYLVGPDGTVVADGIGDAARRLRREFGAPAPAPSD